MGQRVGRWMLPAPLDVAVHGEVARLVWGLPLAPPTGREPSLGLPPIVALAEDDHERRARDERLLERSRHLVVRVIAHLLVGLDAFREAARPRHPLRETNAESLIHITASDERPSKHGMKTPGRRGFPGRRQAGHQHDRCAAAGTNPTHERSGARPRSAPRDSRPTSLLIARRSTASPTMSARRS